MRIRSLDQLDAPRSWARLLWWARRKMEVPDRLPFEVVERLAPGGPQLGFEHHVQPPVIVMATKGSGTVRPFVRLPVVDAFLYQSLVDELASTVEDRLESRDIVFAYRQTLDAGEENQFAGSPTWTDWNDRARELLAGGPNAYCLRADVSGYFVYVSIEELERALLEAGARGDVARDLGELLRLWQMLGMRGLPQGVPSSSALGNFYLSPLDARLRQEGLQHLRYMDDLWVFTDTFSEARKAQDLVERVLYEMGLTLSGEKSTVSRRSTALARSQTAREVVEAHQHLFQEGWEAMLTESYVVEDELPAPHEIEAAAVLDLYHETTAALNRNEFPEGFRPLLRNIYRELRAGERADVITDVPALLTRFPDLTHDAAMYVGYTGKHDLNAALTAFQQMLDRDRFHREQELLEIFRAALFLPAGTLAALADRIAEFALTDDHPLVRARALLAWGAHGDGADFSVADAFWPETQRQWQIYPFAAIQAKDAVERDKRFEQWSEEGRLLHQLGDSIRERMFKWRQI